MDSILRDFRIALRALRVRPGFSFVVVLTLALGIGANTAVFSVLNSVLLRPLPYQEPERLVRVYEKFTMPDGTVQYDQNFLSAPMFRALRESDEVFREVSAFYTYRELGADLTGGDRPERLVRMPITAEYFQVFGIPPLMGRGFTPEEERGGVALAIISHDLWQRRLGGEGDVLGRMLELDGVAHEIVGVMPRGFRGPVGSRVDVWTPENLEANLSNWGNHYLTSVARLAPGVSIQQAESRLAAMARAWAEEEGQVYDGGSASPQLLPLREDRVGDSRATLWVLMAAVGLVLLSTCVNVANLFLVRSFSRMRELALRAALGSGRGALIRQLLSESLLLSGLGGLLGLVLAWGGIQALHALSPPGLPRLEEIGVDAPVLFFTMAVALLTGLAFGLAPALRLSTPNLARELRDGDRGSTGGSRYHRLRSALVVSEVAVALVLLVGAGVLIRSFQSIQAVDLAVDPRGVLTYEVHLPTARYPTGEDRIAFYREFFPRVAALPGVQAVGSTSWLPANGRYHQWGFRIPTLEGDVGDWVGTDVRMVDGEYFRAMGIRVLQGRLPGPEDASDGPPVVVINQRIARDFFPDGDPVGATMSVAGGDRTIIGVVEDVPYDPYGEVSEKVYVPHAQYADNRNWAMIQTVAAEGDPGPLANAIREELRQVDPNLVLFRVRPMEEILGASLSRQSFSLLLMGVFAGMALLLAALGLYGVLSFLVSQRTHEIGIRMALGAQVSDVRRLVVGQGMALVGGGILLGLGAAVYLSRWLRALVFQVQVTDPPVLGAVTLILASVAWFAAYLPARRATRVDPASAFKGG